MTCRLVSDMLRPMESGRKAYHLIGGVLCERTVGEVGPILDSNREAVSRLLAWICG
jgi:prefoldin subunit 2